MNKETFYGIDGFTGRHDGPSSDLTSSPAFSTPEDRNGQGELGKSNSRDPEPLSIFNTNRHFDKYLFYRSSWL